MDANTVWIFILVWSFVIVFIAFRRLRLNAQRAERWRREKEMEKQMRRRDDGMSDNWSDAQKEKFRKLVKD
jgi:hypothetical protein